MLAYRPCSPFFCLHQIVHGSSPHELLLAHGDTIYSEVRQIQMQKIKPHPVQIKAKIVNFEASGSELSATVEILVARTEAASR